MFYLLHNPACLSKALEEVRTTFSKLEDIRAGGRLWSCEYLRACIEEALRMSPPVPNLLPREVLPGGMVIDGNYVPAKTDVGTPAYAVHHKSEYYPEPFSFKPERWLSHAARSSEKASNVEIADLARSAFCAFSVGPRGCVGKQLAYNEMTVMTCRILWLCEMRLAPGSTMGEGGPDRGIGRERVDEYQLHEFFTSHREGPLVQFKLRSDLRSFH